MPQSGGLCLTSFLVSGACCDTSGSRDGICMLGAETVSESGCVLPVEVSLPWSEVSHPAEVPCGSGIMSCMRGSITPLSSFFLPTKRFGGQQYGLI